MFSTPRRRTAGWVLLSVCAVAFILGTVATVASTRQAVDEVRRTQLEGTPLGKQLAKSADRILDCTDSTGECYKRNERRTAQVVGDLNRVIVLAAACSVGLDPNFTVDQRQIAIQGCVLDRLARQAAKP